MGKKLKTTSSTFRKSACTITLEDKQRGNNITTNSVEAVDQEHKIHVVVTAHLGGTQPQGPQLQKLGYRI